MEPPESAAPKLFKNLAFLAFLERRWHEIGYLTAFHLDGPRSLTVKSPEGLYRKKPFIGEEEMTPKSCYLGAKSDLIIQFRSPDVKGLVEMKLAEAQSFLAGFSTHFSMLMDQWDDAVAKDVQQEAAAKESAADALVRRLHADPLFGSW